MGRAPCCDKSGLKKGPWTSEEDQKLIDYIQKNGCGNWRTLPKNAGLQRCGKSCRLRWTNYLRPDIKRGRFSFEEEETIIQLHSALGNKWSAIAARLPGRTDNEIKNYWNTHIRKRLLRMGIDPVTHTPRLDLLDLTTILNYNNLNNNNNGAHHHHHHMNFSRLLGLQSLINPELIRLATSLMSSSSHQIQNPLFMGDSQIAPPMVHNSQITQTTPAQDLIVNNSQFDNYKQFSHGFGSGQFSEWLQNEEGSVNYINNISNDLGADWGYYGSDQSMVDPVPSSEMSQMTSSTFQSNDSNNTNNVGFHQSVLSTPSSSPATLHDSSSTFNNNNNKNVTEDEREIISYCSDMLKFEVPDILDVNHFI